jgi:hypothetical protein
MWKGPPLCQLVPIAAFINHINVGACDLTGCGLEWLDDCGICISIPPYCMLSLTGEQEVLAGSGSLTWRIESQPRTRLVQLCVPIRANECKPFSPVLLLLRLKGGVGTSMAALAICIIKACLPLCQNGLYMITRGETRRNFTILSWRPSASPCPEYCPLRSK